jgi:hypothetical protein
VRVDEAKRRVETVAALRRTTEWGCRAMLFFDTIAFVLLYYITSQNQTRLSTSPPLSPTTPGAPPMSGTPSNLKLALDEYDAQQRRQAALVEAQRIGNLIHIQEQQLVAAKHLAKQRKHARRQHMLAQQQQQQQQLNIASLQAQPPLEALAECAVEDEDEELDPSTCLYFILIIIYFY